MTYNEQDIPFIPIIDWYNLFSFAIHAQILTGISGKSCFVKLSY